MRLRNLCSAAGLLWWSIAMATAQITLNPNPSRSVGHARLAVSTTSPNLVEGRELYTPHGIVVDTDASPPILYVADTGNNRVMAWRNASQFSNGVPADLIIGQRDQYTTLPQGPGTANSTGLNSPVGLAVKEGDLYVVDAGNNRVLRFPKPFGQSVPFPDLVIGQPGLTSRTANAGGLSSRSLAFTSGNNIFRAFLAFDGQGNLWVVDPVNRRVLRYPAGRLQAGNHGPEADLVLGQPDFQTVAAGNPDNQLVLDRFYVPSGIAFDAGGRLYVSDTNTSRQDRIGRVLVFVPSFANGIAARRVMGVVAQVQGQPPPTQEVADRSIMSNPEGVLIIDGRPAVVDSRSSRILVFDRFQDWPPDTLTAPSPQASAVIGQSDFNGRQPNRGQAEASNASLLLPVAATVAGGELFVADTENNRVLVFPQSGLGSVPAANVQAVRVLGQDQFRTNAPNLVEGREFRFVAGGSGDAGMVIDQSSDTPALFVADTYNHRILGFRDARKLKPGDRADLVIGQPDMFRAVCNYPNAQPSRSNLCGPTGLALDAAGNLWVADRGNGRVLRFPRPFAQTGMAQADLVLGQLDFTSRITDPTERTMASPYGIAVEGNNGVLVSDSVHNRVLFFPRAADGSFTSGMAASKVFGQPAFTCPAAGCATAAMNGPRHIATDTDGRLYVADAGNNRVLIFDRVSAAPVTGALPVITLSPSPALRAPRGIFVSAQTGEIWVADSNGNRSVRFPRFEALLTSNAPNATIPGNGPLAVTQDQSGSLYVADGTNRVAIHYPGVAALNALNFLVNRALAPGTIAALFPLGNRFGEETRAFYDFPDPLPLRNELADIQVLVNDVAAPLYAVTPEQINFVVPFGAPSSGTADVQVVRKSTGQILGAGLLQMNVASPALSTVNPNGNGQVYVLNQDGTVNSASNPAPRGSVIALFGTGQGAVAGAPPDGQGAEGQVWTDEMPRVIIGTNFVPDENVKFSGLAPGWPGLWQINVQIPDTVAPGGAVVVAVLYKGIPSNDPQRVRTTIAVSQ